MLFLGILSSLLTAYLSNYALSQLEAAKVSIFNNLSAFITVAAGVLILHETIDWYHLLGGVLVIGGVIGGNVVKNSIHKKSGIFIESRFSYVLLIVDSLV